MFVDDLPLREAHRVRGTFLSSRAQRLSLTEKLPALRGLPHEGCTAVLSTLKQSWGKVEPAVLVPERKEQ